MMNRNARFGLVVVFMVLFMSPGVNSSAGETDQTKVDTKKVQNSDVMQGKGDGEGSLSTQSDEEERYTRLYKAYVEAINKAKNDEERTELRRKFDKETRAYQESLTEEQEILKNREVERKTQALQDENQRKLRLLKQNHDKEVRRMKSECNQAATGMQKNWLALEAVKSSECRQKARTLEEAYQRDKRALENNYNAELNALK
jgi:hypothetical protein